jgi:hypothetical protein
MLIKKSILTTMILLCGFFVENICSAKKNTNQRNLIILNGQNMENVAVSNIFATSFLLAALHQKTAPILVSTCVWRNFIERKQEFAFRAAVPASQECILLAHHNAVINKLNFWTDFFKKQTPNFSDVKLLTTEQVNEEFCTKEALEQLEKDKLTPLNDDLSMDLLFYLFDFDCTAWETYKVTDYYYLLVPKKYIETILSNNTSVKEQQPYTQKEVVLGLKVDHLEQVAEPLDPSLLAFQLDPRPEFEFIKGLYELFITSDDTVYKNITPLMRIDFEWNIFLAGHGVNARPSYSGGSDGVELIANLSVAEFKKLLGFLNTKIETKVFGYSTCFGAGEHLEEPYMTDGKADEFNFHIIINNVTDIVTYCSGLKLLKLPILNDGTFCFDYYSFDQKKNSWIVTINFPTDWKRFFEKINSLSKDAPIDTLCSPDLWRLVDPQYVECIPNIRPKGSDSFMIYQPDRIVKISPLLITLKKSLNQTLVIDSKRTVLLETSAVIVPLIIQGVNAVFPRFVSVISGSAVHYIENLDASDYAIVDLLKGFWPLYSNSFSKIFLIKELICKNDPESPEALILEATDEKIMLNNVMICVEADYLVRIFFQNDKGKSFSSYGRHMQNQEEPTFGLLVPMNEHVVDKYLQHCDSIKQEALTMYEHNQHDNNLDKALKQLALVTTQTVESPAN